MPPIPENPLKPRLIWTKSQLFPRNAFEVLSSSPFPDPTNGWIKSSAQLSTIGYELKWSEVNQLQNKKALLAEVECIVQGSVHNAQCAGLSLECMPID